jgi:hypothetical protein
MLFRLSLRYKTPRKKLFYEIHSPLTGQALALVIHTLSSIGNHRHPLPSPYRVGDHGSARGPFPRRCACASFLDRRRHLPAAAVQQQQSPCSHLFLVGDVVAEHGLLTGVRHEQSRIFRLTRFPSTEICNEILHSHLRCNRTATLGPRPAPRKLVFPIITWKYKLVYTVLLSKKKKFTSS